MFGVLKLGKLGASMKRAGFNPRTLFAASEPGAWYDPSDLSTMFQDAAGTAPVYMPGTGQVEPPVGLWLDKRVGAVRGPNVVINGTFDSDTLDWSKGEGWSISGGALRKAAGVGTVYVNVTQTCMVVGRWYEVTLSVISISTDSAGVSGASFSAVSGSARLRSSPGTVRFIGQASSNLLYLTARQDAAVEIDVVSAREIAGNHAYQTTTTSRPTLSARYNQLTGTESLATQSVPVVATAYTLTTSGPGSVTLSGAASGTYTAGSRMVTCTAGALTLTVLGSVTQADLRPANDGVGLPPYQRVIDANTYDTVGFPLYLKFDGVDDFFQTASVNFSGTDKALVAAAARKLSDAAIGCLVELSSWVGVSGALSIQAPRTASNNLSAALRDATSVAQYSIDGVASPSSFVLRAMFNISATGITNQIGVTANGATPSLSVASAGPVVASALANAPIYIGRRAGTSQPFNGRLYGLLIRGAATPDATVAMVESYLNQKARIY